jgi:hypothetical protein
MLVIRLLMLFLPIKKPPGWVAQILEIFVFAEGAFVDVQGLSARGTGTPAHALVFASAKRSARQNC